MRGLGQMVKSFRDRPVDFPVYDRKNFDTAYLNSLGPVQAPQRDTPNLVSSWAKKNRKQG